MKYRLKTFIPEYFPDQTRFRPQYKYSWWPFWFNGPTFLKEKDALGWIYDNKLNTYPRYTDVR